MPTVLIVASLVNLAICAWWLISVERAARDRRRVMDNMPSLEDGFLEIVTGLTRVSLSRHSWALFLFRDPWLLYPEIIRKNVQ